MVGSILSGNLIKDIVNIEGRLFIIKGSSEYGYEQFAEVLVSNLLDILGIRHIRYKLYCKNSCICDVYNSTAVQRIPLGRYFESEIGCKLEQVPKKYLSIKLEEQLEKLPKHILNDIMLMLFIDAIVANRDRHLWNIEIEKYNDNKLDTLPMYDFGDSLFSGGHRNNKYFKDKAKPFRSTHRSQLKLIKRLGFNYSIKNPNAVYSKWVDISKYELSLMNSVYRENIKRALQYRLNNISNFCI